MTYQELNNYLETEHFAETNPAIYDANQFGSNVILLNGTNSNIEDAKIVLIGCGENRGENDKEAYCTAPDKVREQIYGMYYWHNNIKIADIGNIKQGATFSDTHAAITTVLDFFHQQNKIVVVIGGSHDLSLAQYKVFRNNNELIDITMLDMLVDLGDEEKITSKNFLFEMLTAVPNFVRHFNLLAFQSYYVNPNILETLDKLHFDCHRLGKVRDKIENVEPILRSTDMVSVDMNVVRYADAPSNVATSPNGLHGDELCQIMRYAGMSDSCCSVGLYGYNPALDINDMTARLMAQAFWYFVDGVHFKQVEAAFTDKLQFDEYNVPMYDGFTLFLRSKRTNRWWVQLPNKKYMPCNMDDYITATRGEIPENWLKEMERSMD
jgi:formiminoglutamase